jgi:hypothetical protein
MIHGPYDTAGGPEIGSQSATHTERRWSPVPVIDGRILSALSRVWIRDGRATIRSVATEAGLSPSVTHRRLRRQVDLGMIAYDGPGSYRPGSVS